MMQIIMRLAAGPPIAGLRARSTCEGHGSGSLLVGRSRHELLEVIHEHRRHDD